MMPFRILVDDSEAARVPADGIVVATPTGSTAYFLSAGGPILAPDVAAFGIVALLPHTLFSRPLVVPDTSTIVLACDSEGDCATLEADGQVVDELKTGEQVVDHALPATRPLRAPRAAEFLLRARRQAALERADQGIRDHVTCRGCGAVRSRISASSCGRASISRAG